MLYDNGRGKGDHRHFGRSQRPCRFVSGGRPMADFGAGIEMDTGRTEREAHIVFASPEPLWKVLTAKRRELLKAMTGAGPMSTRDASRRVGRDVKAVHGDVWALLDAGVLDRTPTSPSPSRPGTPSA